MSSLLLEPIFPTLSQAHVTGDNLREFWKLCTKVKDSMQGGRRLENLFWRLWYRYSSPECSLTEQEKVCSFFEKIEWRNNPWEDLKKLKFENHKALTNTSSNFDTQSTTTAPLNVPVPQPAPIPTSVSKPPTAPSNTHLSTAPSKNSMAPTRISGFCVPSASISSTSTKSDTLKSVEQAPSQKKKKKAPKKKSKFFIMSSSEDSESDLESDYEPETEKKPTTTSNAPSLLPRLPSKSQLASRNISHTSETNSTFGKVKPVLTEKEAKSALTTQLKGQRTPFNPFYSRMWERIERFDDGRNDLMEGSESLRMGLMIERQALQPTLLNALDADEPEAFEEKVLAW